VLQDLPCKHGNLAGYHGKSSARQSSIWRETRVILLSAVSQSTKLSTLN